MNPVITLFIYPAALVVVILNKRIKDNLLVPSAEAEYRFANVHTVHVVK